MASALSASIRSFSALSRLTLHGAWQVHGTCTGRDYADHLVNPLIVPLKMIKGAHKPAEHLGVMAVATRVHPQTPVRPAHTQCSSHFSLTSCTQHSL